MQNRFFFIDNNSKSKFNFSINDNAEVNILICLNKTKNLDLLFNQYFNNNSLIINICVWTFDTTNCLLNLKTINNNDLQKTKINIYSLAYNNSNLKIFLESYVASKFIGSEVDQKIKGTIIGESSSITTLPNLNINTNEVIATHSVNIGGIDKDELFYIQTKGFSFDESMSLILNSYYNIVLKNVANKNKYINLIENLINKYNSKD